MARRAKQTWIIFRIVSNGCLAICANQDMYSLVLVNLFHNLWFHKPCTASVSLSCKSLCYRKFNVTFRFR